MAINSRRDPKNGAAGPLDALEQSPFHTDSLKYPQDLENLPHAMVFSINVNDHSKDPSSTDITSVDTLSRSQKVRKDLWQGQNLDIAGIGKGVTGVTPGLNRKTRRIQSNISLYVPETMIFDQGQEYMTPNMLPTLGNVIGGGVSLAGKVAAATTTTIGALVGGSLGHPIIGALLGGGAGLVLRGAAGGVGSAIKQFSTDFGTPGTESNAVLTEFLGYAVNPVIEVIYSTPRLRTFQFDFTFAPRNSKEADNVWEIIQTFRRHSVPIIETSKTPGIGTAVGGVLGGISGAAAGAIAGAGISGAFFIPPAEFDITFFMQDENGNFVQNGNIPGISTCVLNEMNVNYAPENQFVTFKDGMPVHITLRLSFIEIDIIHQALVDAGF